jgi:hypothetical protein
MDIKPLHKASCHCGAVKFEVSLPNGLIDPHRCNCSMCLKRGAITASVPLAGLNIFEGEKLLGLYQFNTMTARHYFCSKCGIYTHHQRRSNPEEFCFNISCLEGIDPLKLGDVPVTDGINHPCDRK